MSTTPIPWVHRRSQGLERRHTSSPFSLGVEAGLHEYLVLRQDLPPDVTGWSSKFEDTRKAWRVTPFVRWGTRGSNVRVYGQIGMGLHVQEHSSLNQQREGGVLVVDEQYAVTDAGAGLHLGLDWACSPAKCRSGSRSASAAMPFPAAETGSTPRS